MLIGVLFLTSCADASNDCDDNQTCQPGFIQTQGCECLQDPSTIIPHPCPNLSCPSGQTVALRDNGTCECIDPAACPGVICPEGQAINADCQCILIAGSEIVSSNITADATWTANNIYTLAARISVEDGATLTIEPGTIIKGASGAGTLASALVVAQGAKIIAEGTADAPIIFTSILDDIQAGQTRGSNLDEQEVGLWGGLLILGRAPISVEGDGETSQIEGIPADDINGLYGGTDAADNSGILKYVSVRHGGAVIGADNEINGITLGGVGSGTVIDQVEVVANKDDGIELFGGTVDVSNALVWAADDDALDIDQGYAGTVDNAVVIAFGGTDHGLEIDGPEGSSTGSFTINNLTVKGVDDELGQYRDGATGTTSNAYFFGFATIADGEGDLSLDDNTTLAGLIFSGLQVVLTEGATSLDEVLKNGIDAFGTVVEEGANTVGANTSVFSWTFASQTGALDF